MTVEFKTKKLPKGKLAHSNSIMINGKDIEEIIGGRRAGSSSCRGCSEIMKEPCECRTYIYHGKNIRKSR